MMRKDDLILAWLGGLILVSLVATFQTAPGYMDAEYYYAGGLQLKRGMGFYEPYLWNYLTDPKSLPIPSHTYWMPLASILSWLGMSLGDRETFAWARIPFLILGSLVSPLTYWLTWKITAQRFSSIFAAILAWLPMFYLAYLPTTDTFAIYMVLGTLWLILASRIKTLRKNEAFYAGIVCGLMHLARADGLVWAILFFCALILVRFDRLDKWGKNFLPRLVLFLVGYGLIMVGWYGRNLIQYGSLFPEGNQRGLFLRTYNDLFRYPPSELNLSYLLQGGILPILRDRFYALGQNLISLLAVQLEILLAPLFLLSYFQRKGQAIVRMATLTWLVMMGLMSIVFPYAGWRGGYFHVSAAFQPFVWCLSSDGLCGFIRWGVQKRNWNAIRASRVFSLAIVAFLFWLTGYIYWNRVIGESLTTPKWQESQQKGQLICLSLHQQFSRNELQHEIIMINNPIGFYLMCELPAVSVPVGGEKAIQMVAQRFGVRILALERDHPPELSQYYFSPRNTDLLTLIGNYDEWKIYRIHNVP
ncbi:MAG: hypothetical protein Kow0088_06490 [Anaerolineales bacterium]